jgi:hypothetical protein
MTATAYLWFIQWRLCFLTSWVLCIWMCFISPDAAVPAFWVHLGQAEAVGWEFN